MQIYKADDIFECGEGILVKKETDRRDKEPHKHEFIEIIFIRSGEGIETVGGVSHTVKRGDMLFVNFGREHSFSNTGMEFIHILLRPEFISDRLISSENIFDIFSLPQFSSIDGELSPSEIVSFSGNELITVTNLIDAMLDEYEMKKKGISIQEMIENLSMSRSAFYRKCNGISEFTQGEIQKIVDILDLDSPMGIFFAEKVS